jgi:thiol-disulfide isomerase/thioredoxin
MTTTRGFPIQISQFLKLYKGKTVLLDFWASWCQPCMNEIPASLQLAKDLNDNHIEVVFVSFDTDQARWKAGMNKNSIRQHSFLVKNNFNSLLAKEFKIISIPRYIILDSEGQVVQVDAPRPGNTLLKELLLKTAKK